MKSGPRSSDPLSAAKQEILLKEQALQRKMEEARKRLDSAPERVKKEKEKQRSLQRIEAVTAASPEYFSRVKQHRRDDSSLGARPPRRKLRAHQREGQVKFLVLCLIFAIILILLWQAMPN